MGMAKVCDVYGTSRGVVTYHIEIVRKVDDHVVADRTVDLCPRAFERFQAKLESAVSPPPPRKGQDNGSG